MMVPFLQKQTCAGIGSCIFMGALLFGLKFPGSGLQSQQKKREKKKREKTLTLSVLKSAHPDQLCLSLPSIPPSVPSGGEESGAETPHWPRWLAANQLQPKVIGSRWETFW